jgi:hypothetical protein
MSHQTLSTSSKVPSDRRVHWQGIPLVLLSLLVVIMLSCGINQNQPGVANQLNPVAPAGHGQLVGVGFKKSDCEAAGIIFPNVTTQYVVDEIYDGPSINCFLSTEGAHGSIQITISIAAYQAGQLDRYYQSQKTTIQSYVDQSTEWNNSDPEMPEDVKDSIKMLFDDQDAYVFMITSDANVQACIQGRGYGTLKLFDRYLVNLQYVSCELANAESFNTAMDNLATAAINAALRVNIAYLQENQP